MAITKSNGRVHWGVHNWASAPAAPATDGQDILIADMGVAGIELRSMGSAWVCPRPQLLARQYTPVSVDGTTTENTLFSLTVPADFIGLNGSLRIRMGWSMTGNVNSKQMKLKLDTANGWLVNITDGTTQSLVTDITMMNRNAKNSQIWGLPDAVTPFTQATVPMRTTTVNTGNAQALAILATKGVGTDTLTLEFVEVWKTA